MTDPKVTMALQVFSSLNVAIKKQTGGKGAIEMAFDLATPAMMKSLPAAVMLVPIMRATILPMVEKMLSSAEYTQIDVALTSIESAASEIGSAAAAARAQIDAMDDAALDAFLKDNSLIREPA